MPSSANDDALATYEEKADVAEAHCALVVVVPTRDDSTLEKDAEALDDEEAAALDQGAAAFDDDEAAAVAAFFEVVSAGAASTVKA